jgi:nicotinamide-nucleotide amidase
MFAEIITIGDEILIGQIVDTNSAIIARELNKIGVSVYQMSSIQDDKAHILQALLEAESRADIVILTGGLGPTRDDITKHTLCEFMEDSLVQDAEVLAHVEELFRKFLSAPISEVNRMQAMVPSKAVILHNANGTAPGMWMEKNGKVFISLPGVQYEMQHMLVNEVIPRICKSFKRPYIVHKTIQTYGMGESAIAEKIAGWEDRLPDFVKLAYLPNLGKVRLRLTAKGNAREPLTRAVETATRELYTIIGDIIHGEEDDESIEAVIAKNLIAKKMTLAAAESFTGGRIASQITAMPGASRYFRGSIVSYATEAKIKVLHVPQKLVETHSVVSEQVAKSMAENARKILCADFAIATTGNAGPEKGDSDADIGTVFIAIATPQHVFAEQFRMGSHRERIVQKSVHKAFEMLRKEILKF